MKISIVVADGRVESVFTDIKDLDVEILDFDGLDDEQNRDLGDYVDALRENPEIEEITL